MCAWCFFFSVYHQQGSSKKDVLNAMITKKFIALTLNIYFKHPSETWLKWSKWNMLHTVWMCF